MKAAATIVSKPKPQFVIVIIKFLILICSGGTTGSTPPIALAVANGDKIKPRATEVSLYFNLLIMFVKKFDLFNCVNDNTLDVLC